MKSEKMSKFIEYKTRDERSKFEKSTSVEKKEIIDTKIIKNDILDKEKMEEVKSFKPSITEKIQSTIYYSIYIGVFIYSISITKSESVPFFGVIALFPIFIFGLIIKMWFINDENEVILNKIGIIHNGNTLYWKDIVSTHIFRHYIPKEINEQSLIVEFKNGDIRSFYITGTKGKKLFDKIFKFAKYSNEELIGHYIEKYKNHYTI